MVTFALEKTVGQKYFMSQIIEKDVNQAKFDYVLQIMPCNFFPPSINFI